jgi:hypothetical protein
MSETTSKKLQALVSNAKANMQSVRERLETSAQSDLDPGIVTSIAMYKETLEKLSQE